MKICIVSDSHDRAEALERAVKDAVARGAQAVVHCGDVIGGHTLRPATWLVNPGTVAGLAAPATWVLGDLDTMRYEVFKISMAP